MKGFFEVFGYVALKRKVLLIVAIIFSIIASALVMYEKNVSITINGSYDSLPEGETNYLYTIDGLDNIVSVDETVIRDEQTYYKLLKRGTTYSYNTYLNTTAYISKLSEKSIATNLDANGNPTSSGYRVKVLFVDQATVKGTGLEAMITPLFSEVTDYDKYVPCLLGSKWIHENYNLKNDRITMKTTMNNYDFAPMDYIPEGTEITVGRINVKLDDYVVVPLIEVDNCKFPDRQSELERWHKIYSVLIGGYIKSDKSANAVQKELFSMVNNEQLPYKIYIKSADYNSRYIFRDDLDGIMQSTKAAGTVALFFNAFILLVYALVNFGGNTRYFRIQSILGKTKFVMILASLLVIVMYFFAAVICGQGAAMIMGKVLGTKVAPASNVIYPQLMISGAVAFILLIRCLIFNPYKDQRRV